MDLCYCQLRVFCGVVSRYSPRSCCADQQSLKQQLVFWWTAAEFDQKGKAVTEIITTKVLYAENENNVYNLL